MRIDISQQIISIGARYKIFMDGQQTHSASSELLSFLPVINLFEKGSQRPKFTINKLWSWFKVKYNITLSDNTILKFRSVSMWKPHFQCRYDEDFFDIYSHRSRKYSVYKNNNQIAWWDKEAVTFGEGDNYKIIANRDSNYELIIAFCLIIDSNFDNRHKSTATFDFGNIGGEAIKFNPDWRPK